MPENLTENPQHDREMHKRLSDILEGMIPTHLITISLFTHRMGLSPRRAYILYSADLKDLQKEIINRFDRAIYGTRRLEMEKFRFFYRLETVSKSGERVFPHVHILVEWDGCDQDQYNLRSDKLHDSLARMCRHKGFQPDIDVRPHDGNKRDYIAKYPLVDIENTADRGLCDETRRKRRLENDPIPLNL